MSTTDPLLATIEPDEVPPAENTPPTRTQTQRDQIVLTPTNHAQRNTSASDMEAGLSGILKQSSHPTVLFFLYFFRIAAIAVYLLCGFFTDNYVLSNVAGRRLVGLRFWNQVDEDGESYWVFESRDVGYDSVKHSAQSNGTSPQPSRPANPIDSKMFWTALYAFPVLWVLLFIVSLLKFNISFLPIVGLALVFNITNVIGFTYADRDAKQRWASSVAAEGWNMGMGGIGGRILGSAVRNSVGRAFGL
ncbi:Golgi apparatus membrane protein TVP23 [Ceratobasidium theobromae]|uniref:Golgi apparatus membrane protein TVP23 n=1 Tax=Ceratobasidium theobromae TaxID=1582974 RepID=A0A5N5QCN8_9AGAM|nr:Golgi apparatus membrane protein TVP23 [Ceratobasidium theobromae]